MIFSKDIAAVLFVSLQIKHQDVKETCHHGKGESRGYFWWQVQSRFSFASADVHTLSFSSSSFLAWDNKIFSGWGQAVFITS